MKIKQKSLAMSNLLCLTKKRNGDINKIIEFAEELRNFIVSNDLYTTGPIMVQDIEGDEEKIKIYMPINTEVNVSENNDLEFIKKLEIEKGICFRHIDSSEPIGVTYRLLELCAEKNNMKIERTFYNIYLNVYGEEIIDVFAPIID